MGLHKWSKGTDRPQPPNPDARRFKVLEEEIVNGRSILHVQYHGCTTFNGKKLLLLSKKWNDCNQIELDPHLINSEHVVLARFQPNMLGAQLAKICAKHLRTL